MSPVINTFVLARVFHVLGVIVWIGGVAMVTLVILPSVRRIEDVERRVSLFEAIEGRFTYFAQASVIVVGLSGLYLLYRMNAWGLFYSLSHWYLHAMVLIWTVFALVLFVLEPLVLHRYFHERARREPERVFRWMTLMHVVLLTMSLMTVAGAVAGSHGYYLF